jgi:hypothetical protein
VQKATAGGGIMNSLASVLGPSLQALAQSRAKLPPSRSRSEPIVTTEQLPDGSTRTTITLADGSSSVFVEGLPQQSGTLTTTHYTASVTYPASTGSLSMEGDQKEDNGGTPENPLDDVVAYSGTLTGAISMPGAPSATLNGSFSETIQFGLGGISFTGDDTWTATVAGAVMTMREQSAYTVPLSGTAAPSGSVTTTITSPDGSRTVTVETQRADGTSSLALSDSATGAQLAINFAADGTGSGSLSVRGHAAGTIEVSAEGIATFHYSDGSTDTFDLSKLEAPEF